MENHINTVKLESLERAFFFSFDTEYSKYRIKHVLIIRDVRLQLSYTIIYTYK